MRSVPPWEVLEAGIIAALEHSWTAMRSLGRLAAEGPTRAFVEQLRTLWPGEDDTALLGHAMTALVCGAALAVRNAWRDLVDIANDTTVHCVRADHNDVLRLCRDFFAGADGGKWPRPDMAWNDEVIVRWLAESKAFHEAVYLVLFDKDRVRRLKPSRCMIQPVVGEPEPAPVAAAEA